MHVSTRNLNRNEIGQRNEADAHLRVPTHLAILEADYVLEGLDDLKQAFADIGFIAKPGSIYYIWWQSVADYHL